MENKNLENTFVDIQQSILIPEDKALQKLDSELVKYHQLKPLIQEDAIKLAANVRNDDSLKKGIESFLSEYDLSNQEGIMLMCLAEALLRVPDALTANNLIKDKLLDGKWEEHVGNSESILVNMSTWGLMLTGNILVEDKNESTSLLRKMISRSGEPVIRKAITQAMRILGKQFVVGQTIKEALSEADKWRQKKENVQYFYSFDMLGEAAVTQADAESYFQSYENAIHAIGKHQAASQDSISIKLSALDPRYEVHQFDKRKNQIFDKLLYLAQLAKRYHIGLTIDAEEAHRLEISLKLIKELAFHNSLQDWNGLGLALQAYQRRAPSAIEWLVELAKCTNRKINIRLVKGAYWDSEIKMAQQDGLSSFPVYTRKSNTDISYIACAHKILSHADYFYPQFATHNAHTLCAIMQMIDDYDIQHYEFQRLFGMGEALYQKARELYQKPIPCRIYAPVGGHKDLLAYLVRRLLENGANTSFVQHIADNKIAISDIVKCPIEKSKSYPSIANPQIATPEKLYGPSRKNAYGPCVYDINTVHKFTKYELKHKALESFSIVNGKRCKNKKPTPMLSPQSNEVVGSTSYAVEKDIQNAFKEAEKYFETWEHKTPAERCKPLLVFAKNLEENWTYWVKLLSVEAGKTFFDSIAELREAIDFCRYYSCQAEKLMSLDQVLPGPTGEENLLYHRGKGTFICISPWNFPLAIFIGQIAAALATGNCVIAKPAEQTPFIAMQAIEELHKAGIPSQALHLIIGDGQVGKALVSNIAHQGVAFTGSFDVAKKIQLDLANQKHAPIKSLIAETGGLNAMLVDSSALPEQVVRDVIRSGFQSAGQRCSALRLLIVQEDIADELITMIKGAMEALTIGDVAKLSTDVGPVIDKAAWENLALYAKKNKSKLIYKTPLPSHLQKGNYIAPHLFMLDKISDIQEEMFGPFVHVVKFSAKKLSKTLDEVNDLGFGLTFGVHSRIQSVSELVKRKIRAGNIYTNRNMIGAVVGVQPFGGEGFSGTGPKAGGPQYLHAFTNERTLSTDTTAAGGNATLLSLCENE